MALIDKLSAIGDAIREKTGTTALIKLEEMPTLILSIQTGGGEGDIPSDIFFVTGDIRNRFKDGSWDYFLTTEPWKDMFYSENITHISSAFSGTTLSEIPFTLNFGGDAANPKAGIDIGSVFSSAKNLTKLPELGTPLYPNAMNYWMSSVEKVTEIPQSWLENFKPDAFYGKVCYIQLPMNCYSLRRLPEEFVKMFKGGYNTSTYQALYSSMIRQNMALDEIRGIPVYGNFTNNAFSNAFGSCYRLQDVIFETNEDGSPIVADWKSQIIDLTSYVGYCPAQTSIMNNCVGFTNSDYVTTSTYRSAAEFEAGVASNPNWFCSELAICRYTRRSAINTFNSLPDTSAYLGLIGGTNTIKLKKSAALARNDDGFSLGIERLTPEEIAVATAKGWTVSLV